MKNKMDTNYYVITKTRMTLIEASEKAIKCLLEISDAKEELCLSILETFFGDYKGHFICTRDKGHSGPHMASGGDSFCALWPQK